MAALHQTSAVLLSRLLLALFYISPILAQFPTIVMYPAYASVEGRYLLIQGGDPGSNLPISRQLYALDLTKSWTDVNPLWISKSITGTATAPAEFYNPSAITKDQMEYIVVGDGGMYFRYHIGMNTWTSEQPANVGVDSNECQMTTDPSTGKMYMPAGGTDPKLMVIYDPLDKSSTTVPMPVGAIFAAPLTDYNVVWSTERRSMLLQGGSSNNGVNFNMYEYQPAVGWSILSTQGFPSGHIDNACLQPASNGQLLILFGGSNTGLMTDWGNTIHILDVRTNIWSSAPSAPFPRGGMACAVSGDYFIAWGGAQVNSNATTRQEPMIFNIKTRQWTTSFVAPVAPITATAPSPAQTSNGADPPPSPSPSPSSNGAAIGGGVGAVFALALIGAFLFMRHRKRTRAATTTSAKDPEQSPTTPGVQDAMSPPPAVEYADQSYSDQSYPSPFAQAAAVPAMSSVYDPYSNHGLPYPSPPPPMFHSPAVSRRSMSPQALPAHLNGTDPSYEGETVYKADYDPEKHGYNMNTFASHASSPLTVYGEQDGSVKVLVGEGSSPGMMTTASEVAGSTTMSPVVSPSMRHSTSGTGGYHF